MRILFKVLLDRYLASSTPGEADDRCYEIERYAMRYGWSDACRDQLDAAEKLIHHRFRMQQMGVTVVIDGDYGSETQIRIYSCETFIGLRCGFRDLNRGRIPIYSDYDCTGLVCGQYARFIKVYKVEGYWIGVIEVCISRDV